MKILTGITTLMIAAATAQGIANAAPVIAYDVPAPSTGNQTFGGSLGMDFVVNSPIQILDLGAFDSGQDGLALPITVSLYDQTNTASPLTSLMFTGTDGTLINGSRFLPVLVNGIATPLTLAPGNYSIVASGYGPNEPDGNTTLGAAPSATNDGGGLVTFTGHGRFGNAGQYPNNPDNAGIPNPYYAGTFEFAAPSGPNPGPAVPETGSLALFTFGLAPLALRLRRRKA